MPVVRENYKVEENISALELIAEQNQHSFIGNASWGMAGGLLLGSLGLLANVLSGDSGKEMYCTKEVYSKLKFVAAIDVNDEKNSRLYLKYKALADKEKNVIFGGRLGEYKYYDMDQVIAAALTMCESEFG